MLVCVEGDPSDDDAAALREALADLTLDGWTFRPEFVDQVDAIPASRPDELAALPTVVVSLELPEPQRQRRLRRSITGPLGSPSLR